MKRLFAFVAGWTFTLAHAVTGTLENPAPPAASGIGLISGWVCQASTVQAVIDGGAPITIPYGGPRADTASVCGGINTGFGLLFNFNTLGDGNHSVSVLADGQSIGTSQVNVATLGSEFLRGAGANTYLYNFPAQGKRTSILW